MLDAARYVAVKGGPKYLAAYEVESVDTVLGPAWENRPIPPWDKRMSPQVIGKNFTRILGEQIFPTGPIDTGRGLAPALQIGRMSVPEGVDAEWNAWYNDEYIPGYLQGARRDLVAALPGGGRQRPLHHRLRVREHRGARHRRVEPPARELVAEVRADARRDDDGERLAGRLPPHLTVVLGAGGGGVTPSSRL